MQSTRIAIGMLLFAGLAFPQREDRTEAVRQAVEKSVALLQASSVEFVKKSGCISCHQQSIGAMAVSAARSRGFKVDETLARQQMKAVAGFMGPHREPMLQSVPTVPGSTIVTTYSLIGLAAENYPADAGTDALVHELAARQRRDGRWRLAMTFENSRPPLDQGDITATALTLRTLDVYAPPGRRAEFDRRIAKGGHWLQSQTPRTTQEMAMRLMGLAWARTGHASIQEAGRALLRTQRPDGGWAQLETLDSDAYATGQVLYALLRSGIVKRTSQVYQRGVAYLLATQGPQGDWHVKSRSLGFQPYFESGYPHGHDQWISSAGGAWATIALALSVEPRRLTARLDPAGN